jgi:hypothetical protein
VKLTQSIIHRGTNREGEEALVLGESPKFSKFTFVPKILGPYVFAKILGKNQGNFFEFFKKIAKFVRF